MGLFKKKLNLLIQKFTKLDKSIQNTPIPPQKVSNFVGQNDLLFIFLSKKPEFFPLNCVICRLFLLYLLFPSEYIS